MANGNVTPDYHTLDQLVRRKEELRRQLEHDREQMGRLWTQLTEKPKDGTQGQMIANIISNSAMAIDAFLLIRKLRKRHSSLFQLFKKKK